MMQYAFRPARVSVALLTLLFVGFVVIEFVSLLSDYSILQLLERVRQGDYVTDDEMRSAELLELLTALLYLGALIPTAVIFCFWIVRASKNARALGAEGMKISPGWSAGWFFVPFMNLWKPVVAVAEIYRASDPRTPESSTEWSSSPTGAIVPVWWTLWLGAGLVGHAAGRMAMGARTVDQSIVAYWVTGVSDLGGLLAAVAAIFLVHTIHKRQLERQAAQSMAIQPVPATRGSGSAPPLPGPGHR